LDQAYHYLQLSHQGGDIGVAELSVAHLVSNKHAFDFVYKMVHLSVVMQGAFLKKLFHEVHLI
jgi:hypothetical protein